MSQPCLTTKPFLIRHVWPMPQWHNHQSKATSQHIMCHVHSKVDHAAGRSSTSTASCKHSSMYFNCWLVTCHLAQLIAYISWLTCCFIATIITLSSSMANQPPMTLNQPLNIPFLPRSSERRHQYSIVFNINWQKMREAELLCVVR